MLPAPAVAAACLRAVSLELMRPPHTHPPTTPTTHAGEKRWSGFLCCHTCRNGAPLSPTALSGSTEHTALLGAGLQVLDALEGLGKVRALM